MSRVPYILFISIFFFDYMALRLHILPKGFVFFPELLSAFLFIFILLKAAHTKSFALHPKYIILFAIYFIHIISAIILNGVPEGAIFSGIRYHMKYIPFFLLPAVYEYSDKQMSMQLKVLLMLALMQLPVSFFQRFVQFRGLFTGDEVRGTLTVSSALSILLISTISVLLALYLKKRLSAKHFIVLIFLLFLPTTINETKGTLILFPLAVFTVLLVSAKDREARKKIMLVSTLLAMFGFVFIGSYSLFYIKEEGRGGVMSFFTNPDQLTHYLYRGSTFDPELLKAKKGGEGVVETAHEEDKQHETRIDRMIAPISLLSNEPLKLVFGLGIGNVNHTKKEVFMGDYMHLSVLIGATSTVISLLLWETGILGLFMFLLFIFMIFKDARKLSNTDSFSGAIALGWLGVVVIFFMSLPYKNVLEFNTLGYLFWYLSGYIVTTHRRQMYELYRKNIRERYSRFSKEKSRHPEE